MTFVRHTSLGFGMGALLVVVGCSSGAADSGNTAGHNQIPGVGDGEMTGKSAPTMDESHATGGGLAPGSAAPGSGGSTNSFVSGATGAGNTTGSAPVAGPSTGDPAGAPPVGATPAVTGPSGEIVGTGSGTTVVGPSNGQAGLLTAGAWDDNRNFDRFLSFRTDMFKSQLPGLLPITLDEQQKSLALFAELPDPKETLDVSFVIDTTGSMGDELSYLQTEFISISDAVHRLYPNAEQRWSLVVYRDTTDPYVVRWFDFRNDAGEFQANLAAQRAEGGGDLPESPEKGLAKMNELAWRTDAATARLAFWVADAPHHAENAGVLAGAVRDARDLGIHIYPVAASGVDDLTELTMRTAAQLTGGRYLFLTNDSGVGGDHKEPRIPCYFVTHLDDAILRMVDIEMSGVYREPDASEIIRTGGNPKDGACLLESGEAVNVF